MLANDLNHRLDYLNRQGLMRERKAINCYGKENNIIHAQEKSFINFSSNDYLGLTKHPKIINAFAKGAEKYGFGSGSSALVSGYFDIQRELEERFANWLGFEKTMLFNSGYSANIGVISALAGRTSTVFSDKLCHASILDGIHLSRAKHYRYKHCSIQHLNQLATTKPNFIITESVFSMGGNIAPIQDIIEFSKKYKSEIIIDDAHGIGVLGKKGGGICEHININPKQLTCLVTPLGKAFNGMGAIVAGSSKTIETILQFSRSYRYTTALPPALCTALHTTLDIVTEEKWRRDQLNEIIGFFIKNALERKLDVSSSEITPIKSIIIGDNHKTVELQNALLSKGFYVAAIRPPTVAKNTARLRISLNCLHKKKQVIQLLDTIFELMK